MKSLVIPKRDFLERCKGELVNPSPLLVGELEPWFPFNKFLAL